MAGSGGVPVTIEIKGMDKLEAALGAVKGALAEQISAGLKDIGRQGQTAVAGAALSMLPRGGGLADGVASAVPKVVVQADRMKFTISDGLAKIDKGQLRHPVFGQDKVWVPQAVPSGYFTKTLEGMATVMESRLSKAVTDAETKIQGMMP